MKLSERIGRVGPSPTLAVASRANALLRAGRDVIAFGAGEPDFDTPEEIKEAARRAMAEGRTKYSPAAGEVALRELIARQAAERWGLEYSTDQVVVSNGAKQSLFNLFATLLDEGDEVIVLAPYWVSYPAQVLLAGGKPVVVPTRASRSFVPSVASLEAAVTPRTRAIIFNSPNNPSGAVWSRADLLTLADWLLGHPDLIAVYDGIYSELVYEGAEYIELAAVRPELVDRVVCVSGVSKSYAMTGWRIGWAMGPRDLMRAVAKYQSHTTSGPNTIAQWAAMAALSLDPAVIGAMREAYNRRRGLACSLLERISGLTLHRPDGTFYVFPDVSAYVGGRAPSGELADDVAIAEYLLDTAEVALVPGSDFGMPGYARISYACDEETLRRGIVRIAEALDRVNR